MDQQLVRGHHAAPGRLSALTEITARNRASCSAGAGRHSRLLPYCDHLTRNESVVRRPRLLPAALLSAALVLSGCGGGGDDGEPQASPEPTEEVAAVEEPATWPLTGLPVKKGSAEKKHPVLVTKIDNTPNSSPQMGLGQADMVVEELVEGGTTRLAAFFYSQLPDVVGPVRSMRTSDIGIVSPVGATVITSGAAQPTIDRINGAGIPFREEGAPGFFRESSRYSPYNLMARPADVAAALKTKSGRPDDYFTFGTAEDLPRGRKAGGLVADFGRQSTAWSFANGRYTNTTSHAGQGDEFLADTVLVLRVEVVDAGYLDGADNPVPETRFTGQGELMLFHGGRVVQGRWSKEDLDAPLTMTAKGQELVVPAGKTWIELVPQETGTVTVSQ